MDIQKLAEEFQEIKKERFLFGLDNGEYINLKFKNSDFYHLLGFTKFKDATIVRMIEAKDYYKSTFYDDVLNGDITFYKTDIFSPKLEMYKVDGKVIHLGDVMEEDLAKKVISHRIPYFSYNTLKEILKSELVVLYDVNQAPSWRKIDADKIFFKYLIEEDKHLNFFIREELNKKAKAEDVPVSFFLETQKEEYFKNGRYYYDKTGVVFRAIYQKETNKCIEFEIFWNKVRMSYSQRNYAGLFRAQIKLQEYIGRGRVTSKAVKDFFDKLCISQQDLKNKIDYVENIINLIIVFETGTEEEKVDSALKLEEYGIDIMYCENVDNLKEKYKLDSQTMKIEISKVNKKLKKVNRYLPDLIELEKIEINYVLEKFISNLDKLTDINYIHLIEVDNIFAETDGKNVIEMVKKQLKRNKTKRRYN